MLTFDATSSLNQGLVGNLISAASTSGKFSVQDFESELAGLIGQVFASVSGSAQGSGSSSAAAAPAATEGSSSSTSAAALSTGQNSGATNSGASAAAAGTSASSSRSGLAAGTSASSGLGTGTVSTGGSSSGSSSSGSAYSAATLAAAAAAAAISPVASEFGITTMPAAAPQHDAVVQSGGLLATANGGIPQADASTPVLDTLGQLIAKNEAAGAALAAASSTSASGSAASASSSSSTSMVQMWDPWTFSQKGPLVPASGIMLTNPSTGQQVDSAAVFSAYENYFPNNNEQMLLNMREEWGAGAVQMWEQQNPTLDPTSGNPWATPTVFQQLGPYNPFQDPNNGGALAMFDSSGTEYLV